MHDQSFREQSHREPKRKLLKEARAYFLNMKKVCRIQNFKNFNPETFLRRSTPFLLLGAIFSMPMGAFFSLYVDTYLGLHPLTKISAGAHELE